MNQLKAYSCVQGINGQTIQKAYLALKRLDHCVHQLSISFIYGLEEPAKTVDFELRPLKKISGDNYKAFVREILTSETYGVADIYPLNSKVEVSFKMTKHVRENHRQEIQSHSKMLDQRSDECNYVRCIVIDFKDKDKSYHDLNTILDAENRFAAFFTENSRQKTDVELKIQQIFRSHRINFLFKEGSLKAKLLTILDSEQARFLNQDADLFCLFCELILNGFKQGCELVRKDNNLCILPENYIAVLNSQLIKNVEGEELRILSPISLITFYSDHYKDLYLDQNDYYKLINLIFKSTHEQKRNDYEKEPKITTIITIRSM